MALSLTARNVSTGPAVRLHSLQSAKSSGPTSKIKLKTLHIVRHAQGYHNVNKDYKNPDHIDAQLTPFGVDQCRELSQRLQREDITVDCIITSPMRRAIQTAYHSFEHLINNTQDSNSSNDSGAIPFVACENWRETVNYLCDARLPRSQLGRDFPYVDFDQIDHDHDPVWDYYEKKFGAHDEYQKHRESGDDEMLERRARAAWKTIAERPEHEEIIAIVSHSAFFMHMFTRPELNVVSYGDDAVKELMTGQGFENCEMRSVAYEIL